VGNGDPRSFRVGVAGEEESIRGMRREGGGPASAGDGGVAGGREGASDLPRLNFREGRQYHPSSGTAEGSRLLRAASRDPRIDTTDGSYPPWERQAAVLHSAPSARAGQM